jgi:beta-galactosidase
MPNKKIVLLFAFVCAAATISFAEIYTPEPSNRVTINLGETPWKFMRSDPVGAQGSGFNDAAWKDVGIPHTWNDTDTYINQSSGGGDGSMFGGTCWYRKHFTLDNKYSGRQIFIEIEGAHVGAMVYINDTMMKGSSAVNPLSTHVIGFMGFVVDITPYVKFGGADNVLAVRVSKTQAGYSDPGFSLVFRFGQADGGLFRPVWMHITDKVHVPLNLYSCVKQWGTYVATQTVAADGSSATVKILTNVQNQGTADQSVTLTTKVVDAASTVVATNTNTATVPARGTYVFDQTASIANPKLWYPNNSTYGTPNMHKVYHIVKVGGVTVDVFESPLGIRVITWDKDFPYINGKKHLLYGASARYDYPALGTALPPEVEWRDAKLLADIGGNLWRPGHSSCSPGFVAACDAYGIMLIQPSGEGEGAFGATSITDARGILKSEIHRDMIIRDRNNPSILAWESSNGGIATPFAQALKAISVQWDPEHTRAQADRTPNAANGDILACTRTSCEIGVKNAWPNNPAWGAEAWGKASWRYSYDYELEFAGEFLQDWKKAKKANCFGLAQWYLAETPGENPYPTSVEGTPGASCRSFGCSMMDFNRIPKFLYYIYGSAWTPFSIKPRVSIAHHWNRLGNVTVNVFSNCPKVRLKINGVVQQTDKVPNAWDIGTNGTSQTSTDMPFQCVWNVTWATGTLRAEGLDAGGNVVCFDEKKTAGAPSRIVLSVDDHIVKPGGEAFTFKANGTDAALILAKVVDADGNWCPTATGNITWSVSGPGNYRGGTDQMVTAGKPLTYHSPLDPELAIEGGMCKVAVRTTFATGTVNVTATSPNLGTGTTSFPVVAAGSTSALRPAAFSTRDADAPLLKIAAGNGMVRYFISQAADVSAEICDANGKILARTQSSRQAQGWHPIALRGAPGRTAGGRSFSGNGVYFVRCSAGGNECVKRIFILR